MAMIEIGRAHPFDYRNNIARLTEAEHVGPAAVSDVKWNDQETLEAVLWPDFVGRTEWKPGEYWRMTNYFQCAIELVLEGEMDVCVDGVNYLVCAPQVYLIGCGTDSLVKAGPAGYCRKIAAGFRGPLLFPTLIANGLYDKVVLEPIDSEMLYRQFCALELLLRCKRECEIPRISGLCVELFCMLKPNTGDDRNRRFEEVLLLMESAVPRKSDIAGIARAVNMSTSTLNRMFQEKKGKSAEQYLIELKMQTALRILHTEPHLSIKEVAWKMGYSDPFLFSRRFRNFFGISPLQYRRRESGNQKAEHL